MTSTLDRPSGSPFEEIPVGGATLENFEFDRGDGSGSRGMEPVFRSRPSGKLLTAVGLVALTIVGLATEAAYLVADMQPDVFAAKSQIQYQGATWVETQSEIVNSRTLLEPVALKEGIPIDEFVANWIAGQKLGTEILELQYNSEDKDQALDIVAAVTDRYLADFKTEAEERPKVILEYEALADSLRDQIAVKSAEVEELTKELRGNIASPALTSALQDRAALNAAYQQVQLQIAGAGIFTQPANTPKLVTQPFLLGSPVAPLPGKRAIFGLVGGLALAAAFVFVALRIAASRV